MEVPEGLFDGGSSASLQYQSRIHCHEWRTVLELSYLTLVEMSLL